MLFYRKDILAELGLEVPQTWDDVVAIIPSEEREYEFGLRANIGTYQMFLYQESLVQGRRDHDQPRCEVAVEHSELTQLYTLHNLLYEYNEANRFRMGEMPC